MPILLPRATTGVVELARVHQPDHAVPLPAAAGGGGARRRLLRVPGRQGHRAGPALPQCAARAEPAPPVAAARGGRRGAQHPTGLRVAEGGARVAARHGDRHPLVGLRRHARRRLPAHVLLHAGHCGARCGLGGLLHRHRAVRVLGDPSRRVHGAGVREGGAARGQVPGAQRPGVPHGGRRVRVDLRVVRGGHRRRQLPVPWPHHPGAGGEPGVDRRGDAQRGEPDGQPGDRALLPPRHAVQRAVQLPARAVVQPRQRLPRLALRAHHRGAPHPRPRAQPAGGRGRVHVLLRALLPQRHERRLRVRQQLGIRPYRGIREGVRAGVSEHVEAVRGAAGDAGAGGRGHHELGVLPDGGDERRAVRGTGGVVDVRDAQALHGHGVAHGVLRGVPDDPDRHGAAAGVRGLLLRVLRREPPLPALRGQPHRGAAEQDEGGRGGRGRGRAHPAVPAPARQRRLTPAAAAAVYRQEHVSPRTGSCDVIPWLPVLAELTGGGGLALASRESKASGEG
ncbi:translation initiation factor IF-2-like isoform X2 [Triticum dicoccoides]|uniref:translation initiation factor IF-2-like isoform X2 n=1 Tax=Triticum dicoccoides TaxID=85692 RepID=UPI0018904F23|nr:translation initiation factor IF-2-like isoform X2 [Triticum dicoccoides]